MDPFGNIITAARKRKKMTQQQVAALIKKTDQQPITAQYHHDIERNRRIPAPYLIGQYADLLDIDRDVLYAAAGALPLDLRQPLQQATPETVVRAYQCFRQAINRKAKRK